MANSGRKHWPVAITAAFLLVLLASFMPWGTIRLHYTSQFMAYMGHPGLNNRIITNEDFSNLKLGTRINLKGSAWKAGFDILGFYYPHFVLAVVGLFLFACAISKYFEYFLINPTIPQFLSFYGVIHVVASALGFFSQGTIGWGLILTGLGFMVFTVSFLRWK